MPRGDHLGEFEQLVLLALMPVGTHAYGLAICKDIEQRTGRAVPIGGTYAALDRLEEKGHVESWLGEPTPERGGRAKRYYRITGLGESTLNQSIQAIEAMRLRKRTPALRAI